MSWKRNQSISEYFLESLKITEHHEYIFSVLEQCIGSNSKVGEKQGILVCVFFFLFSLVKNFKRKI